MTILLIPKYGLYVFVPSLEYGINAVISKQSVPNWTSYPQGQGR